MWPNAQIHDPQDDICTVLPQNLMIFEGNVGTFQVHVSQHLG